jgi:integrase
MSIFKKKSGYYMVDYYVDGKRKREYAGKTLKDAEYLLSKRRTAIYEGKLDLQALNGKMLFRDFAEGYLKKSKTYKRAYKREEVVVKHLKDFFGNKSLGKITASDIEDYREKRLESVVKSSVNRETIVLRHMFNTAVEIGKLMQNPMRNIKQYKVQEHNIRVLLKDEEDALLEESCEHLKPIVITALNTGMRLGELLSLKWENVDMDREVITVTETKSDKIRYIPINKTLKETLKCVKLTNDRVFCDNNGRPMDSIKTAFKNAVRRSGIRHFRFHDLRHTFASRLVEKNVNIVTVKELLGHADINTTMRYSHPAPEYKRQAVDVLNNL